MYNLYFYFFVVLIKKTMNKLITTFFNVINYIKVYKIFYDLLDILCCDELDNNSGLILFFCLLLQFI